MGMKTLVGNLMHLQFEENGTGVNFEVSKDLNGANTLWITLGLKDSDLSVRWVSETEDFVFMVETLSGEYLTESSLDIVSESLKLLNTPDTVKMFKELGFIGG